MERSDSGPRLIVVCGLPGSGKTTYAKRLESSLRVIRFSPDEWMAVLSADLYDEGMRQKIEALQWKFAQELLRIGVTVIIEWGTCPGLSATHCEKEPGALALPLSCGQDQNCNLLVLDAADDAVIFDSIALQTGKWAGQWLTEHFRIFAECYPGSQGIERAFVLWNDPIARGPSVRGDRS